MLNEPTSGYELANEENGTRVYKKPVSNKLFIFNYIG